MTIRYLLPLLAALLLAVLFVDATPAMADSITLTMTDEFSGPDPTGPFPTITFDDEGSAGSAKITFDVSMLSSSDGKANRWYFNFASATARRMGPCS